MRKFSKKRVLVVTDHLVFYESFKKIVARKKIKNAKFSYRYSYFNEEFASKFRHSSLLRTINVNANQKEIVQKYDLVICLHPKQVFPKRLVDNIRCVGIHPGLNPYNRGWFPHVFSIFNGLPTGATLFVMDEKIDHGPIIAQKEIEIYPYDTSSSLHKRVLKAEIELLDKNIERIIKNNYTARKPKKEGNLNYKKNFEKMCRIDLNKKGTFRDFLNLLRALSYEGYKNGYFIDPKTGKKIYVKIDLELEN